MIGGGTGLGPEIAIPGRGTLRLKTGRREGSEGITVKVDRGSVGIGAVTRGTRGDGNNDE